MIVEVENWDLRDTDVFLHHTCLGLVRSISYWYLGDSVVEVFILVTLINTLGLTEKSEAERNSNKLQDCCCF